MQHVERTGPSGVVVLDGHGNVRGLPDALIRAHFRETGALWIRGGNVDPPGFLELVQRFARSLITIDSEERQRHADVPQLQLVTGGEQALNFHTELGHAPNRPEFLSFFCETRAHKGGQTLLADGVALWRALSLPTRRFLTQHRIRYVMRAPHPWWSRFLGGDSPEVVEAALGGVPGLTFKIEHDGVLVTDWCTSAAFLPKFGNQLAVASNVFPYVVPGLTVSMEDGGPVPFRVGVELLAHSASLATPVEWESGDVVLFDNTRWLHGRTKVEDSNRCVHMLMGYLNFGAEDAA